MSLTVLATYVWCLFQQPTKYQCTVDKCLPRPIKYRCNVNTFDIKMMANEGALVVQEYFAISRDLLSDIKKIQQSIGPIEMTVDGAANVSRSSMTEIQRHYHDKHNKLWYKFFCIGELRDELDSAVALMYIDWFDFGYTRRSLKRLLRVEQLFNKLSKC